MVWLADRLHAVALRDRGGMYFLLRESVAEWRKMVEVVEAVSGHRVYNIPALRSEDAAKAVLDAVEAEALEAIERTREELKGELSDRALKTRQERCQQIATKVESYEEALGGKLEALRPLLDELHASIVAAALAVGAEAA